MNRTSEEVSGMIILFGAGKMSVRIEKMLMDIGQEVDYYTDNDCAKWGTYIRGKLVIPPDSLGEYPAKIIIATAYKEEVTRQLYGMGLQNAIATENDLMYWTYLFYLKKSMHYSARNPISSNRISIYVDNLQSAGGWGGIEKYAYTISKRLHAEGMNVCMFADEEQRDRYDDEKFIHYVETKNNLQEDAVNICMEKMMQSFPVFVIDNRVGIVFMAAIILKEIFPNQIRIFSIAHEDNIWSYERKAYWQHKVDYLAGVSKRICDTFLKKYEYNLKKVVYKESFIEEKADYSKQYSTENESIRIGYAARLEKTQKRADLLPEFIDVLETSGINYMLSIAGAGEYKDIISEHIEQRMLGDRVKILGLLDEAQMPEFWLSQDVYVNFSEYEGMSLAMIEAMLYGAVPIVTNVSGTEEVIRDGKNGYLVEIGDLDGIVEKIMCLHADRRLLEEMGEASRGVIKEKCNLDSYIAFLKRIIGENE